MILVDHVHMISTINRDELHAFAAEMGLNRCWFRVGSFPHYDLTTQAKIDKALEIGARRITTREMVSVIRTLKSRYS